MAGTTDHYGLQTLSAGDDFSLTSYKYTNADRAAIDRLLYQGAVAHVHRGGDGITDAPTLGASLTLDLTQGVIPAATRVYYKYTYVDQFGNETAASPESYVETPQSLQTPSAPTLARATTGGTLVAGNYFYVLSAYEDANSQETSAISPNSISVPATTTTNTITLTLPSLPIGADGFNVYRKKPGGLTYLYLASIDMTVATPPTTYVDTGIEEDCNRGLPLANSTNISNAVTIALPGATPTVPVGFTWKIYRTYPAGYYTNSLVTHVVEETVEGSGVIAPTYLDLGAGATTGEPPNANFTYGDPSQIELGDGAEVQGLLPPGHVYGTPVEVILNADGTFVPGRKKDLWLCEYPTFVIKGARAWVTEPGSSTTIVADVSLGAQPDSATTIFTTPANRPSVPAYGYFGSVTIPDVTTVVKGQMLVLDVIADGGGATPNHRNLRVTLYGWAKMTDTTSAGLWV